jgi:hypothetical protein
MGAVLGAFLAWTGRSWYELVPIAAALLVVVLGVAVRAFVRRFRTDLPAEFAVLRTRTMGRDLFEGGAIATLSIFAVSLTNQQLAAAMIQHNFHLIFLSVVYLSLLQAGDLLSDWGLR